MAPRFGISGIFKRKDLTEISIDDEYIKVPVLRGFTEISTLFTIARECDGFICGGYPRWACSTAPKPIPAGDVDIYTTTEKDFLKLKTSMLLSMPTVHSKETRFSITLSYPNAVDIKKIQLIKPEILLSKPKTIVEILDTFDFNLCKASIISSTMAIVHKNFIDDELYQTLRISGEIQNPIMTFYRIMKYSAKGYRVSTSLTSALMNKIQGTDFDGKLDQAILFCNNYLNEKDSGMAIEQIFGQIKDQKPDLKTMWSDTKEI